ncbi:MAG: rhodanese-like domain-containing protein [Planctomycetaceae bacterium]
MTDHPIEIDVEALRDKLAASDDFLLLDCREASEFEIVRLEQATLLPMSELAERVGELEPHRDREIVVHCHHGGRSLRVAMWLRQRGFDRAISLAGGIDAWAERIDSSLPRY